MLLIILCILCTLLILTYIRKWIGVKQYWAVRGVPHETPHPFWGSLTFLQRENPSIWLRKVYEKYNSKTKKIPYFGIWYFWRPALMITSPELARNILIRDSGNFRNRFASTRSGDTLGYYSLFLLNDPLWTKIRRRITPLFTPAKLKSFQPYVQSKTKELVLRIQSEKNNRVDLRDMLADCTSDIIGTWAFGVASDATLTGDSPLRSVTKEFMKYSVYRGISWSCMFFLPELTNIVRSEFFPEKTTGYFRKVFKVIAEQRDINENKNQNKDALDTLLQMRKDGAEDGEDYSDEIILSQAATLLHAGFDTTAVSLTYILYELAFNQEIQEKLYAELLDAKQKPDSDCIDTAVLSELTYLNCVIKEELRKHVAMGWMDRIATKDYVVDENLTIKAGTPVVVNSAGFHYDTEYYPDPYSFDPDRFLPENEKNIPPYTYYPFGEGPRACIGQTFALFVIRAALSAIVLSYKLEPYPDTTKPHNLTADKRALFYMPGEIINVKFIPRAH